MSGHSHWATTKRAKGIKDAARGKIFSKLGRAISIAVKEGGGGDIAANYKLRLAVETARAANMPKENIERAISKGSGEGSALTEAMYEGFGPGGVGLLIAATTDNKNRSAQEIKNALEKHGGSMGGPNSVGFNFVSKGYLFIKKAANPDDQLLVIIDSGVDDFNELPDGIEVYVDPQSLIEVKESLASHGFEITETKLVRKPINEIELSDRDAEKLGNLLDVLDDLDDVDEVYVNAK